MGHAAAAYSDSSIDMSLPSLPSHSGLYRIVQEEYGMQALQSMRYYVNSASKESHL